jgi:hypothetical protein
VEPCSIDRSGSADAIGPRWKKGILASSYVLGWVKVEGRDLDLVQAERQPSQVIPPPYGYDYVVRAIVEGLEGKLWAQTKPIGPVDFDWEGGYLAQLLNADSDLQDMLLRAGSNRLWTSPDERNQCARITPLTVERKAFPTREAFEAYDRIAQHIRSIATDRP